MYIFNDDELVLQRVEQTYHLQSNTLNTINVMQANVCTSQLLCYWTIYNSLDCLQASAH